MHTNQGIENNIKSFILFDLDKHLSKIFFMYMNGENIFLHGSVVRFGSEMFSLYTGSDTKYHSNPEVPFEALYRLVQIIETETGNKIEEIWRSTDNCAAQYKSALTLSISARFSYEMNLVIYEARGTPEHGKGVVDGSCGSGFKNICYDHAYAGKGALTGWDSCVDIVKASYQRKILAFEQGLTKKKPPRKEFQKIEDLAKLMEVNQIFRNDGGKTFKLKGTNKTKTNAAKGIKKGFLFKIDARDLKPDSDTIQELTIPTKETITRRKRYRL